MQILTSIHGRGLGLGESVANGRPLINRGGFVAGEHGSQFALPSPGRIVVTDDFNSNAVDTTRWGFVEGTDGATSAPSILAGGIGGVLRLTTGDAGTGLAADTIQLVQALQWQASNGGLAIEARFKLSQITVCWVFFGFTDVLTLEAPVISAASADTLTTNASDAVGVMFDTRMSTDNWWLTGVATDVDATAQNAGVAPVADTYEVWRIEIGSSGVASFFRNGVPIGSAMSGAVTPGADLTPTFCVSKVSGASSMTADIDYIHVSMNR